MNVKPILVHFRSTFVKTVSQLCLFCLIGNHVACNVIQTNDYIKDCHGVIETSFDQLQEVHREMVMRERAVEEQVANTFKSRTSEITEKVTRCFFTMQRPSSGTTQLA